MALIFMTGVWSRVAQLPTAWAIAVNIIGGVLLLVAVAASVADRATLPGDPEPGSPIDRGPGH